METFSSAYRRMIDAGPSNVVSWTFFIVLWPLALLYRLMTGLRVVCYRIGLLTVYRAAIPVISVGNLTVGGTGKTPVVDWLARKLLARGVRVAVVSRGYGGRFQGDVGCVAAGDGRPRMSPQEAGDEPFLLASRNPSLQVYVARKRALGVQAAEREGAQAILLDDGFQHLAVARDLNIVLLDARAPFGNGQLLPAGPLRESPAALRRADLAIMTHAGTAGAEIPFGGPLLRCRPCLADTLVTLDGHEVAWAALAGQRLFAFAGIARPDDFFMALKARGVLVAATMALNDHQEYTGELLNRLLQSCDNNQLPITTEKDAVKLRAAGFSRPCLVAPLTLAFDEPDRVDGFLAKVLERIKT